MTYGMVSKWYDMGFIVDVVLFDFANALDVVSHHFLKYKLRLLGIYSPLIDWIANFLVCRVMRVSVIRSSLMVVGSGDPQGSVLGPLCPLSSFC